MGKYNKAIFGAITAGLIMLKSVIKDGITADEWLDVALAVLAPFGVVWAVPNSPTVSTSVVRKPDEPPTTITTRTE